MQTTEYTHKKKVKLANKIQHLKRKKDFITVFNIIKEDKSMSTMENVNGMFMMFHKLDNSTYIKIDDTLRDLEKQRAQRTLDSVTSDSITSNVNLYSQDEFPLQKNVSAKLRFSNREKSLIKRRRYDKHMNMCNDTDNDSEVLYTKFNANAISDAISDAVSSPAKSKTEENTLDDQISKSEVLVVAEESPPPKKTKATPKTKPTATPKATPKAKPSKTKSAAT